ncbi:MAG: hypothetical protein AB7H88_07035 [Vicinamibacterales bacterium]
MPLPDPVDPRRRADRILAFREELDTLRAEGACPLTDVQIEAIHRHHDALLTRLVAAYDLDRSPVAARLSRGLQLASIFGAVTLTAGLAALVSRFWGRLDVPAQVGLLGLFPLLALVGVEVAARRERTRYVSSLFAAVALGTCWLAIVQVGEVLDVPLQPPAMWAGVLFGLALGAAYGFRLVLGVSLVAMVVVASGTAFWLEGSLWTAAFERLEPVILGGAGVFVLARWLGAGAPGFASTTRLTGALVVCAGVLTLTLSGEPSVLAFAPGTIRGIYQVVMVLVTAGGIVMGLRSGWRETWLISTVFLLLFLLTRYVDWFWDALPRYAFFLVLAGLTFVTLYVLGRLRARAQRRAA